MGELIKFILDEFYCLLNYILVFFSYGYIGDMHIAINFAIKTRYTHLMIKPIFDYQFNRRFK